ncbi:hypothetical protein D9M70_499210 [compost metagenome]
MSPASGSAAEAVTPMAVPADASSAIWFAMGSPSEGVLKTTGSLVGGTEYSTCRSGAAAGLPSKAPAVRVPVPVIRNTMSLSATQPSRLTISWMIALRSGVRWAGSAAPRVAQSTGAHATDASVA